MYVEINYHIDQYLANDLLEFFFNNNINIKYYIAQGYDNARNVFGRLNEIQDIIINHNLISNIDPLSCEFVKPGWAKCR